MRFKSNFFSKLIISFLIIVFAGALLPSKLLGERVKAEDLLSEEKGEADGVLKQGKAGQDGDFELSIEDDQGEGNKTQGPPLIDLPEWSGLSGREYYPGCYFEANSGIYLGISREEGFLVSYNNGLTWEKKNNGLPKRVVYPFDNSKIRYLTALGVDPANNERLAVTTATGLFLSDDFGESWRQVKKVPDGVYITAVALSPLDKDTIAIGTSYAGIYESKDRGESWRKISGGLYFLMQSRYTEEVSALAYHPEEKDKLIFSCGFGKGLYIMDTFKETAKAFPLPQTGGGFETTNDDEEQKLRWINESAHPPVTGLHFRLNDSPPRFLLKDDWVLEVVTSNSKRSYSLTFMELIAEESARARIKKDTSLSEDARERRLKSADKYGLYVNYAWKRFEDHLPFIKRHNLNSIVVDLKNDLGYLTYDTKLPLPQKIGAVNKKIRIEELIKKAHENGVYIIGRVVVFKDSRLFKYNNYQYALWDRISQKPWAEREYWVDPFSQAVWEYNIAIAKELEELGVDEIQFDYIRFPTDGDLSRISYRHRREGMQKIDALESFLAMAREKIGIPISTDLYGFNCWFRMEGLTGQNADVFSNYVDVISPMFYPSHFPTSFYGEKTYTERARIIYEEGVTRTDMIVEGRSLIRPYIQAFLLGDELKMKASEYTQYLLRQIEGTIAAPSSGFTLWNNSNKYYMVKEPLGAMFSNDSGTATD